MMDCETFWLSCLIIGALASLTEAASSDPFICGADACNIGKDDEYCTEGSQPRCEKCHSEHDLSKCFTKDMAFNCTTYCRGLDKKKTLEEERTKQCPALGNVTNGFHNASDTPQLGEIVQFTCNMGYRVEGFPVIKCLEYGIWSLSLDLPSCTEIVCVAPFVDHGRVTSDDQMTTVGSMVTYKCDPGYTPLDLQAQALCQTDGTWKSLSCDKVASNTGKIWMAVVIVVTAICVILVVVLLYVWLKMKKPKGYEKMIARNGSLRNIDPEEPPSTETPTHFIDGNPTVKMVAHNTSYENSPKEDKKLKSTPLPPRNTNVEPYACPNDDSLASLASSTASSTNLKDVKETNPKSEPEAPRQPSAPGEPTIRIENSSPSKGSEKSSDFSYKIGKTDIHFNFHVNNHNNHNNHNHNNNNIGRHPSNPSNTSVTIKENQETKKKEEIKVPDNTPFPTQASDIDAKGDNAELSESGISSQARVLSARGGNAEDNETAAGDNSDGVTERCRENDTAGIYTQPEDETKPGKLALKNNDVHLNDVKRKRQSSKM